MPFQRTFDESYPRVYDKWQVDGVPYVIQDLAPEDDDAALRILVDDLCTDEVLCNLSEVNKDPVSLRCLCDFWRYYLAKRMSLGCYTEVDGVKRLVALNVCMVSCAGETEHLEVEGENWKNVYAVLEYLETKYDVYEHLGLDKVLKALGLVVSREYRGARIGGRLLAAREPLCLSQGVNGTETVFTGIASQKLAARVGFTTALEVSIKELAEIGLKYPKDDPRVIKVMVKKYE